MRFVLGLNFKNNYNGPFRLLFLGAHCDDIEIGCGGTVLKLAKEHRNLDIVWVIFSSDKNRKQEALSSARAFLKETMKKQIIIKKFKNGFFPYVGGEIKEYFETLKRQVSPDLIFTHYRGDLHQDHRLISDLTWNTFRNHMILEYEIPKYDGDLGSPNVFVPLDEPTCAKKIHFIERFFSSQRDKHWFSQELFQSLMRLRGMESGGSSTSAEAFYGRKLIF
jgi:LmbE family N-acetylglucosaminyl deacetylase